MPLGNPFHPVSDRRNARIADLLLEPSDVRERLSWLIFKNGGEHDPIGRMEKAWKIGLKTETAYVKYYRSEEHTSELQSLMRISYAVFCLKKKNKSYKQLTTLGN